MKEYHVDFGMKTDVTKVIKRSFYSDSPEWARRLTEMLAAAIGGEYTVINPDTNGVSVTYNLREVGNRSDLGLKGGVELTPENIGFLWAMFPVPGDIEDYIKRRNPKAEIREL